MFLLLHSKFQNRWWYNLLNVLFPKFNCWRQDVSYSSGKLILSAMWTGAVSPPHRTCLCSTLDHDWLPDYLQSQITQGPLKSEVWALANFPLAVDKCQTLHMHHSAKPYALSSVCMLSTPRCSLKHGSVAELAVCINEQVFPIKCPQSLYLMLQWLITHTLIAFAFTNHYYFYSRDESAGLQW